MVKDYNIPYRCGIVCKEFDCNNHDKLIDKFIAERDIGKHHPTNSMLTLHVKVRSFAPFYSKEHHTFTIPCFVRTVLPSSGTCKEL